MSGASGSHPRPPGGPLESLPAEALRLPSPAEARSGSPRQFGPYRLQRELGRGASGVVFLAQRTDDPTPVALKVLLDADEDEESLARFELEAQIASKLWHPGIVPVLGAGRVGRYRYCALEYCPGPSLQQRLGAGPLPPLEAARLVAALARAAHYAHEQGVLHRDVKPANVLLDPESGLPRLTDFGLARDRSLRRSLTRTGDVLGTPVFMAPEQIRGERAIDRRADVYSLGATLYQCLTGEVPYLAATIPALVQNVLRGGAPPPSARAPGVPAALDRACMAALAVEAEERTPSAAALADALELAVRELEAPPDAEAGAARLPSWAWALLGAAAVSLAVPALILAARSGGAPSPPTVPAPPAPAEAPPPGPAAARLAPGGELSAIGELLMERFRLIRMPDSLEVAESATPRIQALSEAYPEDPRVALLVVTSRLFSTHEGTALELYRALRAVELEREPLPGTIRGVVARTLAGSGFERAGRDAVEAAADGFRHPWTGLSLMHLRALCAPPVQDVAGACLAAEQTLGLLEQTDRLADPRANPPGFDVLLNLAIYRWSLGQPQAARAALERALPLTPERFARSAQDLEQRMQAGVLGRAEALDRVQGLFGVDPVGRVLQARARRSRTLPVAEAQRLEEALAEFAGDPFEVALLELALAQAYAAAGRPGEAARHLELALDRAAGEPEVRALVARALARLLAVRDPDRAVALARAAAEEPATFSGERAEGWVLVATAELERGDRAAARTALQRAEELAPLDRRELDALAQQVE